MSSRSSSAPAPASVYPPSEVGPARVVRRRYARWVPIPKTALDDDAHEVKALATAALVNDCRRSHLRIDSDIEVHLGRSLPFDGDFPDFPRGLAVAMAEAFVCGLLPEERLPQGWRGFFMAP